MVQVVSPCLGGIIKSRTLAATGQEALTVLEEFSGHFEELLCLIHLEGCMVWALVEEVVEVWFVGALVVSHQSRMGRPAGAAKDPTGIWNLIYFT